jgi:hypothetical protein
LGPGSSLADWDLAVSNQGEGTTQRRRDDVKPDLFCSSLCMGGARNPLVYMFREHRSSSTAVRRGRDSASSERRLGENIYIEWVNMTRCGRYLIRVLMGAKNMERSYKINREIHALYTLSKSLDRSTRQCRRR